MNVTGVQTCALPICVEKLCDDVIEAVNLAFGHTEVLFKLAANLAGFACIGRSVRPCPRARTCARAARRAIARRRLELLELALHKLQVNVEGVKRVADLMRHAGGEQGKRLNPDRKSTRLNSSH